MKDKSHPVHPSSHSSLSTFESSFLVKRTRATPPNTSSSHAYPLGSFLSEESFDHFLSRRRIDSLKRKIHRVTSAAAGVNCLASIIGYLIIKQRNDEESQWKTELKGIVCFMSCLQIALVVSYWRAQRKYAEAVRTALRIHALPVRSLIRSPFALLACLIECVLHLFMPLPAVEFSISGYLFGKPTSWSNDDFLFLVILLRNYHFIRASYWSSRFSSIRTHFFMALFNTRPNYAFFLKYWFFSYSARFITAIYLGMVLLAGLVQYCLEHETHTSSDILIPWDDTWLVSVTEMTIGYGDNTPQTVAGQISVLLSCFFGVFALGLINSILGQKVALRGIEFDMYCGLTHATRKAEYRQEAIVLIQLWWRLMRNRRNRAPDGRVVLALYLHLTTYRSILLRCHGLTSVHFRNQVRNFTRVVQVKLAQTSGHLKPVEDALDAVRQM